MPKPYRMPTAVCSTCGMVVGYFPASRKYLNHSRLGTEEACPESGHIVPFDLTEEARADTAERERQARIKRQRRENYLHYLDATAFAGAPLQGGAPGLGKRS